MDLYLDQIAFTSPHAESWDALTQSFSQETGWEVADEWDIIPQSLSKRAARRVSPQIRLAIAIAEQLAPQLNDDAGWVFASSVGEGETLQVILEALRTPEMMIQPLRFQNAVHNAASGQWSIAAGITGPITSIAALDETAGAGFLKAGLQVVVEKRPVGLVLYDVPLPPPLDDKRPLGVPMGAGFALARVPSKDTLASVALSVCDADVTEPTHTISKALCATGNPVSAVMHLLEMLSGGGPSQVVLGLYGGRGLRLDVEPL
ncbi:MAG: beta-ketoacyl synthase chain length factor [Alphaproteobacteria bacterium]